MPTEPMSKHPAKAQWQRPRARANAQGGSCARLMEVHDSWHYRRSIKSVRSLANILKASRRLDARAGLGRRFGPRVCASVPTLLRIRSRITGYGKETAMLEDAVNCEAALCSHACNAMNLPN